MPSQLICDKPVLSRLTPPWTGEFTKSLFGAMPTECFEDVALFFDIYLFDCPRSQLWNIFTCNMETFSWQHLGSSFPTRDRTQAHCMGSSKSQPLDHQEISVTAHFISFYPCSASLLLSLYSLGPPPKKRPAPKSMSQDLHWQGRGELKQSEGKALGPAGGWGRTEPPSEGRKRHAPTGPQEQVGSVGC